VVDLGDDMKAGRIECADLKIIETHPYLYVPRVTLVI